MYFMDPLLIICFLEQCYWEHISNRIRWLLCLLHYILKFVGEFFLPIINCIIIISKWMFISFKIKKKRYVCTLNYRDLSKLRQISILYIIKPGFLTVNFSVNILWSSVPKLNFLIYPKLQINFLHKYLSYTLKLLTNCVQRRNLRITFWNSIISPMYYAFF